MCEPVDLDSLAAHALGPVRRAHPGATVTVEPLGQAAADPVLLRHLVRAAVDNACRHAVTVVVRRGPGAGVVLEVEDDGPGIPAPDRERMLEEFARGSSGGAGLGLSTCRQIARRYAGSLTLHQGDLGGLLVRADLPGAAPLG